MKQCCGNCKHAEQTDIDGLVDCGIDGRSKDCDMVCDSWAKGDDE